jgi:hypothetical protein
MRKLYRYLRITAFVAVAGTCFQSGCGTVVRYISNINPCGTILVCDPVEYSFVRAGYEGPGANPEIDPACTYPPFCEDDPFVSSLAGGQN